jgi:hypothetical protein
LQKAVVCTGSRLKAGMTKDNPGMTKDNAGMTKNKAGMTKDNPGVTKNKAGMTTLTMEFGHLQTSQGWIKKLYFL